MTFNTIASNYHKAIISAVFSNIKKIRWDLFKSLSMSLAYDLHLRVLEVSLYDYVQSRELFDNNEPINE